MKNDLNTHHINKVEEYVFKVMAKGEMDIVQLFERLAPYANLKTIADYARDNNLSYNGVKKHRRPVDLFGCKLVPDNI